MLRVAEPLLGQLERRELGQGLPRPFEALVEATAQGAKGGEGPLGRPDHLERVVHEASTLAVGRAGPPGRHE